MEYLVMTAIVVFFLVWRLKPVQGIKQITITQLKEKLNQPPSNGDGGGFLLLDVRTRGEFQSGHIPGAVNIPLGNDLAHIPQDREIIVICQSGMRSLSACKQLKKLGYNDITNVKSGMSGW